jgi:hypothetical protein
LCTAADAEIAHPTVEKSKPKKRRKIKEIAGETSAYDITMFKENFFNLLFTSHPSP